MFASSLVEPRSRVPSGDVLPGVPLDAADLDADDALTRRWHDEPGAVHLVGANCALASIPGDDGPHAAHLVGADDALAGLPEHDEPHAVHLVGAGDALADLPEGDEPDAAALADADDAVGVLERWAWFEDPRADDWWVGDALEDAAACLPGAGEAPAADAAEVRAVRPTGAGVGRAVELAGECGGRVVDVVGAGGGRATDLTGPCGDDAPVSRWPWASAEVLEQVPPGPGLAWLLELADPDSLDDAALVESVAAWERLAAWAHLGAALSAGELSRRPSMNPRWSAPAPAKECVAGDELAMRLGWSRPAAGRLVRDGRALAAQLIPVADAVRAGLVDTPKLRVLTDRLHDRADQLSWPVLEQVLPEAPLRTPTQLAADVDRALLAADAEDAAVRLPKALATRHVCHPRRLPDGMAGLWAVLPADDAARVDATLEATARAARAVGDPARWTSCVPTCSPASPPATPSWQGPQSSRAADASRVLRPGRAAIACRAPRSAKVRVQAQAPEMRRASARRSANVSVIRRPWRPAPSSQMPPRSSRETHPGRLARSRRSASRRSTARRTRRRLAVMTPAGAVRPVGGRRGSGSRLFGST